MNSLTMVDLLFLVVPFLCLILYIAFLVKLWLELTDLEKMPPLIDDMHYWMRAQYESEKGLGRISENDMDKADTEIRYHCRLQ